MTSISVKHFLIYKTTNLLNGKIYIGKHETFNKDDGYMGSGKYLKRSISKYGLENFKREILFECSSEDEMNLKEAELVTEEFCDRKDTYNICPGGKGGWAYVNKNIVRDHRPGAKKRNEMHQYKMINDQNYRNKITRKISESLRNSEKFKYGIKNRLNIPTMLGKNHSEETKLKMSKSKVGNKNHSFGKIWVNNGIINKLIKIEDLEPGFIRGRIGVSKKI